MMKDVNVNIPEWKKARKREIKRHIMLIMSWIDLYLGIAEMILAVYLNHDGKAVNDSNVLPCLMLGLITIFIGIGGINYEEIDRNREPAKRQTSLKRNV